MKFMKFFAILVIASKVYGVEVFTAEQLEKLYGDKLTVREAESRLSVSKQYMSATFNAMTIKPGDTIQILFTESIPQTKALEVDFLQTLIRNSEKEISHEYASMGPESADGDRISLLRRGIANNKLKLNQLDGSTRQLPARTGLLTFTVGTDINNLSTAQTSIIKQIKNLTTDSGRTVYNITHTQGVKAVTGSYYTMNTPKFTVPPFSAGGGVWKPVGAAALIMFPLALVAYEAKENQRKANKARNDTNVQVVPADPHDYCEDGCQGTDGGGVP